MILVLTGTILSVVIALTKSAEKLFIDKKFSYKILPELNVSDASIIKTLSVQICLWRHKNIIPGVRAPAGVIYRPASETTLEFIEKINDLISGVTKGNMHYYITGDFNLNLLRREYIISINTRSHPIAAQFIESLFVFQVWFSANDYKTYPYNSLFSDTYRKYLYKQYNCILKKWFDYKWYLRSPTDLFDCFSDYCLLIDNAWHPYYCPRYQRAKG